MTFSLVEVWLSMGVPAKIVGACLIVMGVLTVVPYLWSRQS